ncbi:Methyltransferase domain-containing protein [Parelusimicrobium proximum]|uniref:class I SAM-dependent methyltransferase n=1 Tax=Parelusimicrobium proximum TaxID=3228953 RepID=UPI003D17CEF2
MEDARLFFNTIAPEWDKKERPEVYAFLYKIFEEKRILSSGDKVLDIGCGTGVLAAQFIKYGVKDFLSVDISEGMLAEYHRKYPAYTANTLCADFETYEGLDKNSFDKIIIYNAFPHFERKEFIINKCYALLKEGGVLYIFHSLSREQLAEIHRRAGEEAEDDGIPPDGFFRSAYLEAGFKDMEIDSAGNFWSKAVK